MDGTYSKLNCIIKGIFLEKNASNAHIITGIFYTFQGSDSHSSARSATERMLAFAEMCNITPKDTPNKWLALNRIVANPQRVLFFFSSSDYGRKLIIQRDAEEIANNINHPPRWDW